MKKKKNYLKLFSLIFMILFCCAFQTIVYSAINGTMTVKGEAYARAEADVRITGFRLNRTLNATSSYEEFGKNHITTEIGLLNPSSSITYYVEITNYGSEDAGIFDITGLPSVVNYSIEDYNLHDKICDDTGKCNNFAKKTLLITLTTTDSFAGSIQMNFDFRTYHTVTYTDIENKGYPTEVIDGGNLNITFKEDLKRVLVLSDNNELGYYSLISNGQTIIFNNIIKDIEVKFKEQVAKLKKGSINEIGSEVCIEEECFYIISNNGSTITMLSKMNITLDNNPVQSTTAGKTAFSSTNYWSSTTYPVYVYNSNSNLYNYVENYKNYLEGLGVELNDSRLITIEELESIGCSSSTYTCSKEKSWVYETDYWSGSAKSSTNLWRVYSGNSLHYNSYTNDYYGIRPVIEISIDEIEPLVKVKHGDYDTVGSEICIDTECFYVISSTADTVTMLAKYNLYIGGDYNWNTRVYTGYGEEATGKQESTMIGYDYNDNISKGVVAFSDSYYWESYTYQFPSYIYNSNSNVYKYVENYRKYIEDIGIPVKNARVINYEEISNLGCTMQSDSCTYDWVSSTTYWSGEAYDDCGYILALYHTSFFNGLIDFSYGSMYAGVRPIIVIDKSNL